MELSAPGYHAIGGTFTGLFGIAIGRTNNTAWGITNSKIDAVDWFEEQTKFDENGDKVALKDDKWHKMEKRVEIIKMRGVGEVEYPVYSTRHGVDLDCPVFDGIKDYSVFKKINPIDVGLSLENLAFCMP